jgi:hypothetical protein
MNPQSVFIDPLLTSVYIGYKNTELIADVLAPKVQVSKESGIFFKNDKSNLIVPGETTRALTGSANRISGTLTTDTYTLEEHTLEEWIDDRILKTYDSPFDPQKNATNRIAGQLMIEKENELIAALSAATASGNVVDSAGNWSTAGTNLRTAVLTGKDYIHVRTGVRPNTLVLDRLTYNQLISTNTDFKASIAYTSDKTEANMRNLIAGYFDVENVLIAGGIKQSAATSGTGSFLWSTKGIAYLAYINPTPAIEEPSALYQFFKPDMIGVDVRREEGHKSDVVRVNDFYVMEVVDSECLYKFLDTVTD